MTSAQFNEYWALTYPATVPIPHYFKWDYPDRWFRIHSLPGSKRYADDDEEWATLLERQNTLITDLIGIRAAFCIVAGSYDNDVAFSDLLEEGLLQAPHFQPLGPIDLHALSAQEYDADTLYRPAVATQIWQPTKFDSLLKAIADDRTRAFFVGVTQRCLVAPYDGGVDIIVESAFVRDAYKEKYKAWLSNRDDGL